MIKSSHIAAPAVVLQPRIIERIVNGKLSTNISGGRGVGKSVLLKKVATELKVPIIRGEAENAGKALQEIVRATAANESPILIDDLDDVFGEEVYEAVNAAAALGLRIVFTSTTPPDITLLVMSKAYPEPKMSIALQRIWSQFTMKTETENVDPWDANWRGRIRQQLHQVVSPAARGDQLLLSELTTAVVHLTGGHPSLVDPAIAHCNLLHGDGASQELADLASSYRLSGERRQFFYAHLEDALFASPGFRRIHHAARSLHKNAPEAYQYLVERARNGEIEFAAPLEHKRVLTEHAVVSQNPRTRKLSVAGELLRRLISNTASKPSLQIVDSADDHGSIAVTIGGRRMLVGLRGTAWTIMRELYNQRDNAVSVDGLARAAGLDPTGVRSAIQRIKSEFAEAGVDGVVENVWGKGYQLCAFPLLASE